jgi:glycerophosphoryl diester phosphodiesterase
MTIVVLAAAMLLAAPVPSGVERDTVEPMPFTQSATTVDALMALGRPVVLAHTGGEGEFPGSTMYAFRRSMAAGVDVLDLNVVLTADGVLAVQHDLDVDRQADGTGLVSEMTFADLHELDNAFWFTTECGPCRDQSDDEYVFRGVRTGVVPPPAGFSADDFAVPRLEDLLDAFPDIPLGIEIKADGEVGAATADALVAVLTDFDRLDAVVVSSFSDDVIAHVQEIAPDIDVSPGAGALTEFLAHGTPLPAGQRVVQPPPLPADKVAALHDAGYVVWVWPNDRQLEHLDAYVTLLADGYDALNVNFPADGIRAVEAFLNGS